MIHDIALVLLAVAGAWALVDILGTLIWLDAHQDVSRRVELGLPQLQERPAEWWRRELNRSVTARFHYGRMRAVENKHGPICGRTVTTSGSRTSEPVNRRLEPQMRNLFGKAFAGCAIWGLVVSWLTGSQARGIVVGSVLASAIGLVTWYVVRAGSTNGG